ncbi:hypothetical protein LLG95_02255 [bacterium]|nr:hypothetical protein [bacterium]
MQKTESKISSGIPAWRAFAAAFVCALIAVAIVYPGLVAGRDIPISTEVFGFSDLIDQNLPLRVWGGMELARGRLPLWYPGCFGGVPLAGIPEAAAYYLPSAVFYMIASPGPATAWTIVFHLLIAGVGAAMVARHFRIGLGGQLLAAVLMSIGLHLPAHVRQLNIMQAEAWLPWVWLFLDRLLIRPGRRDVAGLGLSMGMLGLAGHPEILHHAVVLFSVWAIIRTVRLFRQWWDLRFWAQRALAVAVAALIAGAVALPNLGPLCDMMRWVHRAPSRSLPDLNALALLLRPWMLDDPAIGDVGPNSFFKTVLWEEMFYIGRLPVVFALGCVLFSARRRRLRIGLIGIAGASLLLAFASQYHATQWIPKIIPMELSSRFPHRYLWAFNMALVVVAALGFDGLLRALGRYRFITPPVVVAFVSIVLLVAAIDIARVTRRLNPMGDSSALVGRPATLDMFEKAGASLGRFAERLSNYGILPLAITTFRAKPGWSPNPTLDMEFHRFLVSEHASMWGWQSVGGYVGMDPFWSGLIMGDNHTLGVLTKLDAQDGTPIDKFSRRPDAYIAWSGFFGGRWMVSPIELASPLLRPVGKIPGKYYQAHGYENTAWAGGAWISRDLKIFDSDKAICGELMASMPDRNCIRMVRADVPPAAKTVAAGGVASDSVEAPQWPDPQHVTVNCRLERPGFLVLNQGYYPDWRVRVDDAAPQKPLRVNVCQTGVWLAAGPHRVSFEYPGRREKACLAIGLIGLMAVVALIVRKNHPA